MKNLLNNKKGQGTTEYIVILALAVFMAVVIFWPQVKTMLGTAVTQISTNIGKASTGG